MEFDYDLSLKEWAKDKPLSILQLDPADRAVLRIAVTLGENLFLKTSNPSESSLPVRRYNFLNYPKIYPAMVDMFRAVRPRLITSDSAFQEVLSVCSRLPASSQTPLPGGQGTAISECLSPRKVAFTTALGTSPHVTLWTGPYPEKKMFDTHFIQSTRCRQR
ncbi:hypothetical protein L9F63_013263, partial [Diploptera punctata]